VAASDDPRAIDDRKAALRAEMRRRRAQIPGAERTRLAEEVQQRLFSLAELRTPRTVMVFSSFGSEVPTEDLISGLRARGHRVLLPIVEDDTLEAVRFEPGDPMIETTYGPREPAGRVPVDPDEIDVVIIPGLAFDRRGRRLGYGGAYFDRYLPRLATHAVTVGIGFHRQLVKAVPSDRHDVRLDMVVTDREIVVRQRPQRNQRPKP
jgi:5-formyltetrahydrofolate cyclo-ligase